MATKISRKDRQRSRRRRLTGAQRQENALTAQGAEAIRSRTGPKDEIRVVEPPKGLGKLSQVITDFAMPMLKEVEDWEDRKAIAGVVAIALNAWNLALVSKRRRSSMLKSITKKLGKKGPEKTLLAAMLMTMIARKEALFAEDKRFVGDYELTWTAPGKFHLTVSYEVVT